MVKGVNNVRKRLEKQKAPRPAARRPPTCSS